MADHQHERPPKGEVQTETGEALKGPKPLKLPEGKQQQSGGAKQQGGQHNDELRQQQAGQGDDRTPDKPIGQVAYADRQKNQSEGGAGNTQVSNLEPERQGGIGGP